MDWVFLQSGRGFLAKWMGFSCKVDGVFLRDMRKQSPTPTPTSFSFLKFVQVEFQVGVEFDNSVENDEDLNIPPSLQKKKYKNKKGIPMLGSFFLKPLQHELYKYAKEIG